MDSVKNAKLMFARQRSGERMPVSADLWLWISALKEEALSSQQSKSSVVTAIHNNNSSSMVNISNIGGSLSGKTVNNPSQSQLESSDFSRVASDSAAAGGR